MDVGAKRTTCVVPSANVISGLGANACWWNAYAKAAAGSRKLRHELPLCGSYPLGWLFPAEIRSLLWAIPIMRGRVQNGASGVSELGDVHA